MADKNEKPWYRDLRYWAIIATIAAAIISSPIWMPNNNPPDFSIAIDPMQGAVQQGGVISTSITIKGIQGYEYKVSLSATGQPPEVVIAFVPPIEEAKPSYTSSVTINVDKNVPAGDYTLVIKGTGANGKEHSCSYTLTVKSSVTPTPTLIITPTPTPKPTEINIIDSMENTMGWIPRIGDETESSIDIESIPGRTGNAIAISYDLKENGYVSILKEIKPEILSGKDGLRFFYKGSGRPNTLAVELVYNDPNITCFGVKWNSSTAIDDWVSIEAPYSNFRCFWPNESCLHYGDKVDLEYVRRISFAIMNEPEAGDRYGSGRVIIDDVQGITS